MTTSDTASLVPNGSRSPLDGRRARSRSSRARIAAAMLDLVGAGNVAPSAAEIAEHAGVGLRSVFRHFKDMDALYREMTEEIQQRILPILMRPLEGETWQARLVDLAARRAQVYEAIMPYRISSSVRRFESAFLMEDYMRMLLMEAQSVLSLLPPQVRADAAGTQGLSVIMSFVTWRLLRHDQGLPPEEAAAVVRRMLEDALARWPQE